MNTVRNGFTKTVLATEERWMCSSATAGEHTRGTDRSAWVTSGSLSSLEQPVDLLLERSVILDWRQSHVFSVYGWLSKLTYFRFFPVICWSYLLTEISVILSTGNKSHSRHHLFFSFLWNHFVAISWWRG